jgi:hypothetical protein
LNYLFITPLCSTESFPKKKPDTLPLPPPPPPPALSEEGNDQSQVSRVEADIMQSFKVAKRKVENRA